MSSIKESFNQISPSEFFYRNRDLAGFSNPTRSLYTAVREFVENSLDACDQQRILPEVHLSIKAVDPELQDPKQYILTVKDNGPGVESKHIPLAFGTVLYGSKFGLKQARGMFGLGATMAILYGQITTNKPVTVKSSVDGKVQHDYELLLDIQKNKPVIQKHNIKEVSKTGLTVSIYLEGDYSKAGTKIRDYVYQTSLITPYATITFDDPKGQKFHYGRIVKTMPPAPTIIRPHPYGTDVETIRRMIVDSQFTIPAVDNKMIEKVRKDLGLKKKNLSYTAIMERAKTRWKSLSRQVRVVLALMSFLKMDFDQLSKIKIEDIDVANQQLTYWDFGESQSKTVKMDPQSSYYRQLINTVQGETLASFLTKRFQRVGQTTAAKFSEFAGFKPETRIGKMSNQELVKLSESLQKFDDFLSPDPSCLAPLGEEPLEKGMNKFFNPDFCAVIQRPASAYSGFPFVVEMGIAYGGDIPAGGIKVYRFANRIPLLYDEGSDVVLKVVHDTDWTRYKVKGDPPLVVVSHICSTRIPYKTVGKENVADRQEIERELKLALQYLSRKLSSYMSKKGQAEMAKRRANLYAKYIPLIAQFATELSGKKKEPNYKKMLQEEVIVEEVKS
ncbi:MAG: DNA topoisomerase VI subunit B [Nitrosopumilaceae archaeon]|nr:DNA topoisomerase VI subunit B [Nitrosopumilaceae archaeon]NIT99474.1 DNA topoisomerase VI subunit B [Nitrosopumilaceae archaeon]NIU85833.1 DNA topoisomerase VI subunit B [Nitrosopumilaceae archaeon]NIV64690.1 DNA topoisomerase VI subunit B [Nitrosopumilaceae archaeon]NIX60077.1 DNA topoisomerase VI subunit B [Nitrosopumilaceae archaeon]